MVLGICVCKLVPFRYPLLANFARYGVGYVGLGEWTQRMSVGLVASGRLILRRATQRYIRMEYSIHAQGSSAVPPWGNCLYRVSEKEGGSGNLESLETGQRGNSSKQVLSAGLVHDLYSIFDCFWRSMSHLREIRTFLHRQAAPLPSLIQSTFEEYTRHHYRCLEKTHRLRCMDARLEEVLSSYVCTRACPTKLTIGSDIRLSWALLSLLGGGGKGFRMSGPLA
jgi:hypothetical protein